VLQISTNVTFNQKFDCNVIIPYFRFLVILYHMKKLLHLRIHSSIVLE